MSNLLHFICRVLFISVELSWDNCEFHFYFNSELHDAETRITITAVITSRKACLSQSLVLELY